MNSLKYILCFLFVLCNPALRAQINNLNFEQSPAGQYTSSTGVSDWTVTSAPSNIANCGVYNWSFASSQFQILQTPFAYASPFGIINNSPLGGNKIAQLNSTTGSTLVTRIRNTFTVSAGQSLLQYAFCLSFIDGGHTCCQQPFGQVRLYNCSGTLLTNYELWANAVGPLCTTGASGYSVTNTETWANWQTKLIDLSAYAGSCITIEVIAGDCVDGSHHGMLFFDAALSPGYINPANAAVPFVSTVNPVGYCSGSYYAVINAPPGNLGYMWISPVTGTIPQYLGGSAPSLTIANPIAGSVFTIIVNDPFLNVIPYTVTITTTTVNITNLGATATCSNGTAGSATVIASGASVPYAYSWINSTNSVVGTGSVVNNLAPGIYSITVSASGCGSAVSTVTVGTAPPGLSLTLKPYCGSEAYFYLNSSNANYQWYHNSAPFTPTLASGSNFTVPVMPPNDSYTLAYNNPQGCRDSVAYIMDDNVYPGNVTVSNNSVCAGNVSGGPLITLNPLPSPYPGPYTFTVFSTGATPSYSNINTFSGAYTTYTSILSGLFAGGTYSLTAFDGVCKYNTLFGVNTYSPNNYTMIANQSFSLCSGNSMIVSMHFNSPPQLYQYLYNWTPATFLSGTNQTTSIIMPVVPAGTSSVLVYTVVATPTAINCPQTETFTVTVTNMPAPQIAATPDFCPGVLAYTVAATPPGGIFSVFANSVGVISPHAAGPGLHPFTYSYSLNGCTLGTSATFSVRPSPDITFSSTAEFYGTETAFCVGSSATLTALSSPSCTYLWNGSVPGATLAISPLATSYYTVLVTDTYSCTNTSQITASVIPFPVISITGNTLICQGQTTTLSASGADYYLWSLGPSFSPSITDEPYSTSVYTVAGTTGSSCTSINEVTVQVVPEIVLDVSGKTIICRGESVTFTPSGADLYSMNGTPFEQSIVITPTVNAFCSFSASDSLHVCTAYEAITVTVFICTGIDELSEKNDVSDPYPNPTTGNIAIVLIQQSQATLSDAGGKIIFEKPLDAGSIHIDLSPYANGIYFLKVTDTNKITRHFKLLKIQ